MFLKEFPKLSIEFPETKEDIAQLGIETYVLDDTSPILDWLVSNELGSVTLDGSVSVLDEIIPLVAGHNAVVGQYLEFFEGQASKQVEIVAVNSNNITIAMPMGQPYTVAAIVKRTNCNMAGATGTFASPVIFKFAPTGTAVFHINRAILVMEHAAAGDDSKFGDGTALTNGVVFRQKLGSFYGHLFNARTNGDLRMRLYDLNYDDKAGGGKFSTSVRRSFGGKDKNGVVVKVDPNTSDAVEVLVRDTVPASITKLKIALQGHLNERNGDV